MIVIVVDDEHIGGCTTQRAGREQPAEPTAHDNDARTPLPLHALSRYAYGGDGADYGSFQGRAPIRGYASARGRGIAAIASERAMTPVAGAAPAAR